MQCLLSAELGNGRKIINESAESKIRVSIKCRQLHTYTHRVASVDRMMTHPKAL